MGTQEKSGICQQNDGGTELFSLTAVAPRFPTTSGQSGRLRDQGGSGGQGDHLEPSGPSHYSTVDAAIFKHPLPYIPIFLLSLA